jgi:hypothetical protein
MRKIGAHELEDIALGAIKECGPVTLLDPDEVADGAFVEARFV